MQRIVFAALLVTLIPGCTEHDATPHLWQWSFTGTGVSASGTFSTDGTPDVHGYYAITGIAGTVNGATITGLQANGTPIPGNAGFPVDNLVRSAEPQLTAHGFGFSVANGDYHNPFYQGRYLDYISLPPYADGAGAEPPIRFMAARVRGAVR